jgi:hypothetical protein
MDMVPLGRLSELVDVPDHVRMCVQIKLRNGPLRLAESTVLEQRFLCFHTSGQMTYIES